MGVFTEKEIKEFRYLFPVCKHWIYLNHASVAPISLRAADAIHLVSQESLHQGFTLFQEWVKQMEKARGQAAHLIQATPQEVAFVKNTSHGLSLIAQGLTWKHGDEIIISESEFPSNVYPWMALQSQGVVLKKIPNRAGELAMEALEGMITPRTRLVSLSSVQYGTGYRLELEKAGALLKEKNVLFAVDAIQSLGLYPLDVEEAKIDFLAADAHKWLLGPEGIGIFYARRDLIPKLKPPLIGWNSVEDPLDFDRIHFELRKDAGRFEEGSPATFMIYALGAAIDLLLEVGVERIRERVHELTEHLIHGLQALPVTVKNSLKPEHRSGMVLFSLLENHEAHKLMELEQHLREKKIVASHRQGAIRLSPHFYNTKEEMDKTLKEIEHFLKA